MTSTPYPISRGPSTRSPEGKGHRSREWPRSTFLRPLCPSQRPVNPKSSHAHGRKADAQSGGPPTPVPGADVPSGRRAGVRVTDARPGVRARAPGCHPPSRWAGWGEGRRMLSAAPAESQGLCLHPAGRGARPLHSRTRSSGCRLPPQPGDPGGQGCALGAWGGVWSSRLRALAWWGQPSQGCSGRRGGRRRPRVRREARRGKLRHKEGRDRWDRGGRGRPWIAPFPLPLRKKLNGRGRPPETRRDGNAVSRATRRERSLTSPRVGRPARPRPPVGRPRPRPPAGKPHW